MCASVITQSYYRVDSGGATCGNICGDECDKAEQQDHGGEGCWICRLGAIKHGCDGTGGDVRGYCAEEYARDSEAHGLGDDPALDVAGGGPEGHADSYLLCLACYGVRDYTIDAECGEE